MFKFEGATPLTLKSKKPGTEAGLMDAGRVPWHRFGTQVLLDSQREFGGNPALATLVVANVEPVTGTGNDIDNRA